MVRPEVPTPNRNRLVSIAVSVGDRAAAADAENAIRARGWSVVRLRDADLTHVDLAVLSPGTAGDSDGIAVASTLIESHGIPIIFALDNDPAASVERIAASDVVHHGCWSPSSGGAVLAEEVRAALRVSGAARELRCSRDRYRSIARLSGDIVVRHNTRKECTCVNEAGRTFWGIPERKTSGRTVLEFLHPQDREQALSAVTATLEKQEFVQGCTNRQQTPNGWRTVQWNSAPILDSSGVCVGVQVTGRDITDAVGPSRAARGFFDSLPILLCVCDSNGRFLRVNREWNRILGYGRGDVEGQSFTAFVHEEDIEPTYAALDRVRSGERLDGFVNRYRAAGGRYRHLEWSSFAVDDAIYSSATDVTSRVDAETAVQNLLTEKSMLLREAYHRVKNDLVLVKSLLHIQSSNTDNDATKQALDGAADRIAVVSRTYERLQNVDATESLDISGFLRAVADGLLAQHQSPALRIAIDAPQIQIPSRTAVSIGIVLNELVTNAVKHALPPRGELDLRVEVSVAPDRQLRMQVSDNGPGFPTHVLDHPERSFGLFIAGGMARSHHGSLTLSNQEGANIEVRMTLPQSGT